MTSAVNDYSLDRGLPASPEVERSILGAILLDNERALEAVQELCTADFFLDAHRQIYATIRDLEAANKPIEIGSLTQELLDRKALEFVGGAGYLASLTDGVPRRSSIAHYISIVREKATLRNLIHVGNGMVASALDQTAKADEVLFNAEESLLSLMSGCDAGKTPVLREQCLSVIEQMQWERTIPNETLLGVPTGIEDLDELTTGIRPSELWVIGAPQGRAKTALALQMARNAAMHEIPVAVRSMEMKGDPVLRRCISAVSGIPAVKFKDPRRLSEDEMLRAEQAAVQLSKLPLILDDQPVKSLSQFIAKSRLYVRRDHIKVLFVDHLFALAAISPGRDTRTKVETAAEALRRFAYDENIGVVLLHHTRKPSEANAKPDEDDLKETGNVAIHAHVILMLWREIATEQTSTHNRGEFNSNDEIIAAKIRDGGERGTFPTWFDKRTLEWKSRELRGMS